MTLFSRPELSHEHSLETLNCLYEYDDFMESIDTLVDVGCGPGLDLEWWATRTTRDKKAIPLNIRCLGIDLMTELPMAYRYPNIQYCLQDFENPITMHKHKYDIVWCHDAFQYAVSPLSTLKNWWKMMTPGAMLVIIVPQTTNLKFNIQEFDQQDHCYYNHTIVSMIHMLAISGFDCNLGFFKKNANDSWLHAVVYKSNHEPMNPKITKWYDLCELELLPDSAVKSIQQHGYLRQQDLILPWLDKSLMSFYNQ